MKPRRELLRQLCVLWPDGPRWEIPGSFLRTLVQRKGLKIRIAGGVAGERGGLHRTLPRGTYSQAALRVLRAEACHQF